MTITITSTDRVVEVQTPAGEIPARVWEGKTESGISVWCLVTRVGVYASSYQSQFERELAEQPAPASPSAVECFPLRMIL